MLDSPSAIGQDGKFAMAARSQRAGAGPYFHYAWTSSTAFSVVRPAAAGKRGKVSYSLTPTFTWNASPRVVNFRFKKPGKGGAISWSLA